MAIMDETILPPARPVGRPRTRTERPEDYDTPEEIERRRLYMARYKQENKERLLAYYRTWKETHREQSRTSNREYVARVRQARRIAKAQAAAAAAAEASPAAESY